MLLRIAAAILTGLGFCIISPPTGGHWVHWFLFVPLLWALREGEGKRNAWIGYLAGWVGVFCAFAWLIQTVVRFSNLPWALGLVVHIIFATAFAAPYALVFGTVLWFRKRLGLWWILVFPALQVVAEAASPALFPYYHGVTQYRFTSMWQLTSVTGPAGLTFLIFLVNGALAELLYRRREGRPMAWRPLVGALTLVGLNLVFGTWRHGRVEAVLEAAPTIQAGLIQQDVTMEHRLSAGRMEALGSWVKLTRKVAPMKPDLVVWPEGAIPFNPHSERESKRLGGRSPRTFFETMAGSGNFDLLIGGGTIEEDPSAARGYKAYNSAFLFGRDGELSDRYDKMVPLPFGEYVPLSDIFPVLNEVVEGPGDFRSGTRPTVFQGTRADGEAYHFSVPICYEAILSSQMRSMFAPDGEPVDLFVNITNDAWFGDGFEPHQHGMLATVQAMQFGRPLLRSTYTGVSFLVEPHGDILYETEPYTTDWAVETIRLGAVETVYTRIGWIFPWLCSLGVLGAIFLGRRNRED